MSLDSADQCRRCCTNGRWAHEVEIGSFETNFWDSVLRQQGQNWNRFDTKKEIVTSLRPYLGLPDVPVIISQPAKELKICVVGSGPSSDIGYRGWPDAEVTLFLTDPLATRYKRSFSVFNAFPPASIIPLARSFSNFSSPTHSI